MIKTLIIYYKSIIKYTFYDMVYEIYDIDKSINITFIDKLISVIKSFILILLSLLDPLFTIVRIIFLYKVTVSIIKSIVVHTKEK